MGAPKSRYCVRAVPGKGWRIWNRKMKKWYGNFTKEFPSDKINELNTRRKKGVS